MEETRRDCFILLGDRLQDENYSTSSFFRQDRKTVTGPTFFPPSLIKRGTWVKGKLHAEVQARAPAFEPHGDLPKMLLMAGTRGLRSIKREKKGG